jgi:hypothetical protein
MIVKKILNRIEKIKRNFMLLAKNNPTKAGSSR